ncbi:MAG: hypothetical protein ABUS54_10245 [Actinomycetota bacterium]
MEATWTDAAAGVERGALIVASLYAPPPPLSALGNFRVVRNPLDASDKEVVVVSPLADVSLENDEMFVRRTIAREIALSQLEEISKSSFGAEDYLRLRRNIETFCTPEEIVFLREVTWELVASEAERAAESFVSKIDDTLAGEHADDALQGYVPNAPSLRRKAHEVMAGNRNRIVRFGNVINQWMRQRDDGLRAIMEEPPGGRAGWTDFWGRGELDDRRAK